MPRSFSVEHAKSGRAKCKKCAEKIQKDSLRMGTHSESSDDYPSMTNWFHLKCFKKKIRKGPPTKNDIVGFKSLSASNKKKVLKYVFGDAYADESDSSSSSSSSDDDDAPIIKKKTRKRKLSSDEESKDEPPKKKDKIKYNKY
eukprot:UN00571